MSGARIRSGYSFRTAAGMIEDVAERLVEINATYAPLTDRASTFGWVRWDKLCKKHGLKPLFGVELAVTESLNAKKPIVDYWTFIALDDIKYVNELVFLATSQFRYEPLLTYEQAANAPGVIKIVGHRSMLDKFLPQPDIFIALSPSVSKGYINQALKKGHSLIAASDNKFIRPGDEGFYEVLCGRGASTQTYAQHICSRAEWEGSVARVVGSEEIERSWTNFEAVGARCTAGLKKANLLSPPKEKTLEQMCREGARKLGCDLSDPVYEARLQRELELIKEKEFEDYFYIIADMMQFARQRMICGPARGSSCGSLVCFLLEITTVDPIPYGLLFERFVDVSRADLPDIDVDLSDQKRHMVFEYMEEKYGRDHIARLGTVALFRPRSAIDETGAALKVPKWLCQKVVDSLIVRSGGDSRALQTLEDTLNGTAAGRELVEKHPEMLVAAKMEGHPRHHSQHAAGIVVTDKPVSDYIAIDSRTGATHCDKKDAEELNLLKIDALGLTQLSVFEDALTMAGKDIHFLERVPLDDKKAFDVLNKGQFSGIFQFNGPALQSITNQIKIESLEDIVSVTALARPGPMASGGTNEWVRRKNGQSPVTYPHPVFEPYLKNTIGIVCYQEQILSIGREIGGLSWADVTDLRKAMSKSLGKEFFDKYGDRFKIGAIEKGVPAEILDKLWSDLCSFGAWCLSGDTILENPHPSQSMKKTFTIKELWERGGCTKSQQEWEEKNSAGSGPKRQKLFCMQGDGIRPVENVNVVHMGKKVTFNLKTPSHEIRATAEHKFLTRDRGWQMLKDLEIGELIAVKGPRQLSDRKKKTGTGSGRHNWRHLELAGKPLFKRQREILRSKFSVCQECLSAPYEETHHRNGDHKDHELDNLIPVCRKCHKRLHREQGLVPKAHTRGASVAWIEVASIEEFGEEEVFDISMPAPHHNFIANGIVVHNCFNRSHAVAYGIVSYWCAYLKAHMPFEFAAATLSHEADPQRQIMILREMNAEGIEYVPYDANLSTDKWTAGWRDGKKVLVGPLHNVKGIGPKMVQQILSARARGEPIPPRAEKLLTGSTTDIDSLWPIKNSFKRLMPDPSERNIHTPPTSIIDLQTNGEEYSALVFATISQIKPRDENEVVDVAKRGGRVLKGPTTSLNLTVQDDTDRIFGKIDRFDYERIGKEIVDRGRPGKALYALKGVVPRDFRMLKVKQARFIGFTDD